jgi:hypothetical protein
MIAAALDSSIALSFNAIGLQPWKDDDGDHWGFYVEQDESPKMTEVRRLSARMARYWYKMARMMRDEEPLDYEMPDELRGVVPELSV